MKLTPEKHGYLKCQRCGSHRPSASLVRVTMHAQDATVERVECADAGYCSRAAGVGRGELDGGGTPRGPGLDGEVKP